MRGEVNIDVLEGAHTSCGFWTSPLTDEPDYHAELDQA